MSGDESADWRPRKKIAELEAEIDALKKKNAIQDQGKRSDKKPNTRRIEVDVGCRAERSGIRRENRAYAREMDQRLKNHLGAGLKPRDFRNKPRYQPNPQPHKCTEKKVAEQR
ncbi:hypothetical protein TSAR_010582 [Trichomalopsis sarcophagae]|uniref:Uncharacterized protein n=1 Tax=Trichomalopsis sarcophagae TaxID=543379 RepID=A0A232ED79_9HYME|nr:hypothetical protein TSAR_010582 [Trichomalopsis sarcophagae]